MLVNESNMKQNDIFKGTLQPSLLTLQYSSVLSLYYLNSGLGVSVSLLLFYPFLLLGFEKCLFSDCAYACSYNQLFQQALDFIA